MFETKKTIRLALVCFTSLMLSGCMNVDQVRDSAERGAGVTLGVMGAFAVVGAIGALMSTPSKPKPFEVRVIK